MAHTIDIDNHPDPAAILAEVRERSKKHVILFKFEHDQVPLDPKSAEWGLKLMRVGALIAAAGNGIPIPNKPAPKPTPAPEPAPEPTPAPEPVVAEPADAAPKSGGRPPTITEEQIINIKAARDTGMSWADTAVAGGCSVPTAQKYYRQAKEG